MARQNQEIDHIDAHIGQKIYKLRLALGMSRQELGDKIGVTHQQCQKYEKGTNRISAGRLVLIAKVLNRDISYFYEDINKDISNISTHQQRLCIEVARNFMKINNPIHRNAVNNLVKTLAGETSR